MKKIIYFYMVTISPWCFLSLNRLKTLSDKYDLIIKVKPIDIFAIFKSYGTKVLKERPLAMQKNRINELIRWGNHLNIKFNVVPKFHPVNPEISSKIIIAAYLYLQNNEKAFALVKRLCEAVWINELDVSDIETLQNIAFELGFDNKIIENFLTDNEILKLYDKNTKDASEKGVFGVPSFIYDNELFFGQDRMFMIEDKIISK